MNVLYDRERGFPIVNYLKRFRVSDSKTNTFFTTQTLLQKKKLWSPNKKGIQIPQVAISFS